MTVRPPRNDVSLQRTLRVELGARSYPIRIGPGLLHGPLPVGDLQGRPQKLITDENVAAHYLGAALAGFRLTREDALVLPPGESLKTWASAGRVLDWLLAARLPRDGIVIALGGGVIGDLAGFCAAIYQRGIDYVQVPTTLLAQVDSSVGGKTGVNHPAGKNLVGAFHQPACVLVDTATLVTLPRRELLAGLAEVIKYGMLADSLLFEWLESNLDRLLALDNLFLTEAIERCCSIKSRIVGRDERETGSDRALLNLGHTFGHAMETHTGYASLLHGEAVAIGLCLAADLSMRQGWISPAVALRCRRLIERTGLPTDPPRGMSVADFHRHMGLDKKVKAGKLRLVLMRKLGEAVLTSEFDPALLDETLTAACSDG